MNPTRRNVKRSIKVTTLSVACLAMAILWPELAHGLLSRTATEASARISPVAFLDPWYKIFTSSSTLHELLTHRGIPVS